MLASLEQAISREEPIVFTGWAPHFIFENHDLKFLEDPQNILGDVEDIHTVMVDALDVDFEEASENWIADNRWIKGVDDVDGESPDLVFSLGIQSEHLVK